jgi:hypothetical protein
VLDFLCCAALCVGLSLVQRSAIKCETKIKKSPVCVGKKEHEETILCVMKSYINFRPISHCHSIRLTILALIQTDTCALKPYFAAYFIRSLLVCTEHRSRVINTPDSYLGGPVFTSWPKIGYPECSPSWQVPG